MNTSFFVSERDPGQPLTRLSQEEVETYAKLEPVSLDVLVDWITQRRIPFAQSFHQKRYAGHTIEILPVTCTNSVRQRSSEDDNGVREITSIFDTNLRWRLETSSLDKEVILHFKVGPDSASAFSVELVNRIKNKRVDNAGSSDYTASIDKWTADTMRSMIKSHQNRTRASSETSHRTIGKVDMNDCFMGEIAGEELAIQSRSLLGGTKQSIMWYPKWSADLFSDDKYFKEFIAVEL